MKYTEIQVHTELRTYLTWNGDLKTERKVTHVWQSYPRLGIGILAAELEGHRNVGL